MADTILRASDLLSDGESAVAVTTDGKRFRVGPDGTGETGNWRVDQSRQPRRVIIHRTTGDGSAAEVYLADFVRFRPSDEDGRAVIDFANAERVGLTERGWKEFASASQNPVRYLPA